MMRMHVLGLAFLMLAGCDDFFEKDISGEKVGLTVPGEGVETECAGQLFCWKEVEGASGYHLRIVTPGFEQPACCVLDTLLTDCSFRQELCPGVYEWQVNAYNSAWATAYSSRTLVILPVGGENRESHDTE